MNLIYTIFVHVQRLTQCDHEQDSCLCANDFVQNEKIHEIITYKQILNEHHPIPNNSELV